MLAPNLWDAAFRRGSWTQHGASTQTGPMDPSPIVAIAVILVGAASGVLAGMVGVGGAVITTPGIRFLGATPIEAIGSTIPAILPAAVAGAVRYHRAGLVVWSLALVTGVTGSGFSVLGAWLSDIVDARALMLVTAGMVGLSAVQMWRARHGAPPDPGPPAPPDPGPPTPPDPGPPTPPDPGPPAPPSGSEAPEAPAPSVPVGAGAGTTPSPPAAAMAAIGAGAGMLAGLLGVGGGLVLVPGFTHLLGLDPKRAVATSLPAVAILSIPAMVTHAVLGHVNWSYALLLTVGVIPGARVGARFTIGGSEARLRLVMSLFFGLLAIVYGTRELLAP